MMHLPISDGGFAADDGLLERLRLLPILPRLALGVGEELVRLLLGVENGFLLVRFARRARRP